MRRVGIASVLGHVTLALFFLGAVPRAAAQPSLPQDALKTGERFRAVFRPVTRDVRQSTVRVLANGEPAALGLIVSDKGHILTKQSQLRGKVTVLLADGSEEAASRLTADHVSDLALLKISTKGHQLTAAEWASDEPAVGAWLVSVGQEPSPIGVGIVSVAGREIAPQRGVLGIEVDDDPEGPLVANVFPGSGAAAAGLTAGDVITAVEDENIPSRAALLEYLSRFRPGDSLRLAVRREGKTEKLLATLGNESTTMVDRQARQNMMAGPLSLRSGGFDRAIQHDTVLRPEDCGGPVVDLTGRVVGVNIARAGRVESYALPASTVRPILSKLLSDASRTAKN